MNQKPTVGRIVHFVLPPEHKRAGEVRPAIIVMVNGSDPHATVNPNVFLDPANDEPLRSFDACSVTYDESPKPALRTWCWPPRS